ncbi:MAG: hypothetical protein QOF10_6104 [Kribbellaceae bacterium]|jgi:hypothetical protein|nr:hypothetical protein [Kribbellaceae bacterium]
MSQHLPAETGPIRIGDAERDRAVAALSDHFVAGRLTQDEFEERSNQATRARYDVDLKPLFVDLPAAAPSQHGERAWSAGSQPGPQRFRGALPPLLFLLPLLSVGMVIATVSLAAPWILWVLFWIAMFGGPYNHRGWHPPHRR